VLEALFDRIAVAAGMMRMAEVMTATDPQRMLGAFVETFTRFWSKNRLLLRRIHGIAAIDPEFGRAVEARNQRRKMAATRVIGRLHGGGHGMAPEEMEKRLRSSWR
jgi:hypothetical protein